MSSNFKRIRFFILVVVISVPGFTFAMEPVAPTGELTLSQSKNLFDLSKRESAEIHFTIFAPEDISLTVYDRNGKEIFHLQKSFLAGDNVFLWNGQDKDGNDVAAGAYTALLDKNGLRQKLTLMVLK